MRSKLAVGGLTVAVAFLLATNPVVVDAAGQITGAQIKDNSIKGKDVKNSSLTGKDLKDESIGSADIGSSQVSSSEIADGSVGAAEIADGTVGTADLATDARGAKVTRYPVPGTNDFSASSLLCAQIPVTAVDVRSSEWSATMESGGIEFTIGDWGLGPNSEYRVSIEPDTGRACIIKVSGAGETYSNITFYRTAASTTAPTVTVVPRPANRG